MLDNVCLSRPNAINTRPSTFPYLARSTAAGDIQQEIQYATKENPLGRESYGLMMLCNVLVPILEHGLRQDWRSVLPPATVLSSSSRWAQSLVKQARGAQPTAWDVLEVPSSLLKHATTESQVPMASVVHEKAQPGLDVAVAQPCFNSGFS